MLRERTETKICHNLFLDIMLWEWVIRTIDLPITHKLNFKGAKGQGTRRQRTIL